MSKSQKYILKLTDDHVFSVSNINPIEGLIELIWNALDADARNITITLTKELQNVKITVADDGDGFSHSDALFRFVHLGKSEKKGQEFTNGGRSMHGSQGSGRIKAFSVARVIEWRVAYKEGGKVYEFMIDGVREKLSEIYISEPETSTQDTSGVIVKLTEIYDKFKEFKGDNFVDKIAKSIAVRFAPYLVCYRDVCITINDKLINYQKFSSGKTTIAIPPIEDNGKTFGAEIEILEWVGNKNRRIWVSDMSGFPLTAISCDRGILLSNNFIIFIKSDYYRVFLDKKKPLLLEIDNLNSDYINNATMKIEEYFRNKNARDGSNQLKKWKENLVYPYSKEPQSNIKKFEMKVFDILAVKSSKNSSILRNASKKNTKAILSSYKHAFSSPSNAPPPSSFDPPSASDASSASISPPTCDSSRSSDPPPTDTHPPSNSTSNTSNVEILFSQFYGLSRNEQDALINLISEYSLSIIIKFNIFVVDRLKKIKWFEKKVFDKELNIKERGELHKYVLENLWILGENYSLLSSDQSLTSTLNDLKKRGVFNSANDERVKDMDGKEGRADLVLGRKVINGQRDCLEFLVVELKRPAYKITSKDIDQVKKYLKMIVSDGVFQSTRHKVIWNFWLITNDYDDWVEMELEKMGSEFGIIDVYRKNNCRYTVWVMQWRDIIENNKNKLREFQEELERDLEKDKSAESVKKKYDELFKFNNSDNYL